MAGNNLTDHITLPITAAHKGEFKFFYEYFVKIHPICCKCIFNELILH